MNRIIGRCSRCKGNVVTPEAWMGIVPPPVTCEKCRAVAAAVEDHLPTIPMVPMVPRGPRRLGNARAD